MTSLIVVSEDEEADHRPFQFLQSSLKGDVLNISHDYRYQKMGYYVSMHAELLGCRVEPRTVDILDTHRNPLLLLRAKNAGIPCVPYRMEVNECPNPSLCYAINPYTCNSMTVVDKKWKAPATMKHLSVNYRFPVSVQPLLGDIVEGVSVFGQTDTPELKVLAQKVYQEFRIPIGKIIAQIVNGDARLSHFEPCTQKEVPWGTVREKINSLKAL